MKTVSAFCFALATVVAGGALSAAPSYAQTNSADQQVCGSDGSWDGANCVSTSSHKMGERDHTFHDRARSDGRAQ